MSDKLGPYLLGPNDENQGIYTGDARKLAKAIPDESVDLIFTDPVYQNIDDYRWLAETAARVLKPHGHLIAFFQTNLARETSNALFSGGMKTIWILNTYHRGGPSPRLAIGHTKQKLAWLCLRQTDEMWQHNLVDVIEDVTVPKHAQFHKWQKNGRAISKWSFSLTETHDIIVDFFCGGGTVLKTAKMLGRRWLAFEILPNVAETARQRVAQTQPPLFTLEAEQTRMAI